MSKYTRTGKIRHGKAQERAIRRAEADLATIPGLLALQGGEVLLRMSGTKHNLFDFGATMNEGSEDETFHIVYVRGVAGAAELRKLLPQIGKAAGIFDEPVVSPEVLPPTGPSNDPSVLVASGRTSCDAALENNPPRTGEF